MMSSSVSFSRCLFCVLGLYLLFTSVSADGLNPQSHPAAGEIIEVEKPYTIVWTPGTTGNVTIVLMANSNWKAQTIASSTSNIGTYTWTPEASLASENSGSNYFLQICQSDDTNECTYTLNGRFGFTNSQAASSSSVTATATASATGISVESPSPVSSSTTSSSLSSSTVISSSAATGLAASPSTSSGGLSTTAKIAVGVVLSIVVTAALLVGAFMLLRRRKRSRSPPIYEKPEHGIQPAKAELYDSSLDPSELPSTTPNTAPAPLHELDTHHGHTGQP